MRPCGKALRKSIAYLIQLLLLVSLSSPHPQREEGSHPEDGAGFNLALKQLQGVSWAKAKLEWELAHRGEGLTRKYKDQ